MSLEDEVTAILAERVASLVDDHASRNEPAAMLKAATQLRELMDTLPIRGEEAPGRDSSDARGQVLQLFDGPPTLGDTAEP